MLGRCARAHLSRDGSSTPQGKRDAFFRSKLFKKTLAVEVGKAPQIAQRAAGSAALAASHLSMGGRRLGLVDYNSERVAKGAYYLKFAVSIHANLTQKSCEIAQPEWRWQLLCGR
jgi:hypothetical protein